MLSTLLGTPVHMHIQAIIQSCGNSVMYNIMQIQFRKLQLMFTSKIKIGEKHEIFWTLTVTLLVVPDVLV